MGRRQIVTTKLLYNTLRYVIVATLLMAAAECTTVELKHRRARYYDPKHGTEKEDIHEHFNLHRGRWWNYYDRGSVYLAYGHYKKAHKNFAEAMAKRSSDKWDARTYGLHFIDYFPHRESGVTYYFQGEQETDVTEKERLLGKAICELEKSLSQEESSRAKFYLNESRRSLWQVTKEKDKTPPTIHLKKPIYTNQRTVRFDITVTDQDSHVKDIRIGSSSGDIQIDRPRLFIELAEKKVERTVEFTVGPKDKYAVVTITASDLAGNESDPNNTLIIVDKQAPTAGINIVGDNIRPDSPVKVFIEAMDDFGLKQIQVGDNPNNKIDCDGSMTYPCTITGMPKGGELAITVVDNAGNTMTASIPVEEDTRRTQLSRATRLQTSRRSPLTKAGNGNRPLSQAYLPASGFPMPRSSVSLYQEAYMQASSFTVVPKHTANRDSETGAPEFRFHTYVKPEKKKGKDIPKETSQDSFTVDGYLWNPLDVNRIKLYMDKEKIDEKVIPPKSFKFFAFTSDVNISDIPVGETKTIKVEAYRKNNRFKPSITDFLKVKKVYDVSREADSIYGILLLPLSLTSDTIKPSLLPGWSTSRLSYIYEEVLREFKCRTMSDRYISKSHTPESDEPIEAFRVYHVNDIYRIPNTEAWYKLHKNEGEVVRDLLDWRNRGKRNGSNFIDPNGVDPNLIDLVVYGDLIVYYTKDNNKQGFDIKLKAVDVVSGGYLKFPTELDDTYVLANASFITHMIDRTQTMNDNTAWLALNAAKHIPRLHAKIKVENTNIRGTKPQIKFEFGREQRAFVRMKCWIYEKDTEKNAKLTKIDCLDIIDIEPYSTWIECDKKQTPLPKDASLCTAITK